VIVLNPEWEYGVAIDTGYFTAAVWGAVDFYGNMIVYRSYLAENKIVAEHSKEFLSYQAIDGVLPTYVIDPGSQVKLEYIANGIYCIDGDNSVDAGNNYVSSLMRIDKDKPVGLEWNNPQLLILSDGEGNDKLLRQMRNYRRRDVRGVVKDDRQREKIRKVDDHLCDALRYLCMAKLFPQKRWRQGVVGSKLASRVSPHIEHIRGMARNLRNGNSRWESPYDFQLGVDY